MQNIFIVAFGIYSLSCFLLGFRQVYIKKNPYGLARWFSFLGAFVWTDAVTFGAFFFFASIISLILQDFILFLLIFFVFWAVRSIGETIYWFLEQFANPHKNKPETLQGHTFFPGDSIYIHYQIFWQCVSVISIIASVYLFTRWL